MRINHQTMTLLSVIGALCILTAILRGCRPAPEKVSQDISELMHLAADIGFEHGRDGDSRATMHTRISRTFENATAD